MFRRFCIFAGSANPELASEIANVVGSPICRSRLAKFSDGETFCEIKESVRGVETYIVQPTSTPVNDNLMELLIMIDALRRASAGSITAIMPYYGYGRQDCKAAPRTPITAKLCADLLVSAGVTRVVCVDLHAAQIQGFFNIPFDHLFARPVFHRQYLQQHFDGSACVVSPDASGVERARAYSKRLGASLAIVDRRHDRSREGQATRLVGDVNGKDCIIVDDIVDSATTLCETSQLLAERGARRICACVSHAVLTAGAVERIEQSALEEVVVTNSIPLTPEAGTSGKIKALSLGPLLGDAIQRIHTNDSVSSLFA